MRGLKLLNEACFCYFNTINFSINYSAGGLWENLGNWHATCSIQTALLIFSVDPNIAGICPVDWKDLKWRADSYHFLCYRGRFTTPLFQKLFFCKNYDAARYWRRVCKQLLYSNYRNRVFWAVSGLSQDGACTELFENLSVESLSLPIEIIPLYHCQSTSWSVSLKTSKRANMIF